MFLPLSLSSRVLDEEYNPGFESSLNFDMPFCFSATPLLDFEGDFKRPFRVLWSPNLTIWGQCFRAFPKNGLVTPRSIFGNGIFPVPPDVELVEAVMSLKSLRKFE